VGSSFLTGKMASARITKGVARYIANFTPPALPLPTQGPPDQYFENVTLLAINDDAPNGSIAFIDQSNLNLAIVPSGGAVYTNTNPLTGMETTAELTADYLQISAVNGLNVLSGPFTIEASLYLTSSGIHTALWYGGGSLGWNINNGNSWAFYFSAGVPTFSYNNGAGASGDLTAPAITLSAWHHFAITWDGATARLFIDGVLASSTAVLPVEVNFPTALDIGGQRSGNDLWSGQIGPVRITKGVARYTANFAPPPLPLSAQGFTRSTRYYA
jgi:Concanavalin A-like lectin/glucanases superfamily